MYRPIRILFAALPALLVLLSAAFAHAVLLGSSVVDGESIDSSQREIFLKFSEVVEPRFSSFKVETAAGSDESVSVIFDDKDRKQVTLKLEQPLPAGGYRVRWKVVTVDTHQTEGRFVFLVR